MTAEEIADQLDLIVRTRFADEAPGAVRQATMVVFMEAARRDGGASVKVSIRYPRPGKGVRR